MRDQIIALARAQIGYTEGSNNDTIFGAAYGLNNNPWCLMFIWWCATKNGVGADVIPKTANCPTAVAWFKARGQWHARGTYTPRAADRSGWSFRLRCNR